jgi:hypothetical protein
VDPFCTKLYKPITPEVSNMTQRGWESSPVYSWIHSHSLSRLLFSCTEIVGTHTPTHLAHTDSAAEWCSWAFRV